MTERHIIKVSVQLKSTKLLVRFPCKLTFQLKTGNSLPRQTRDNLIPDRPTN